MTAGADGKPQAHCPAQDELVATQPGPLLRLQQEEPLPEPQQDIPLPAVSSCCRGTACVAKNATNARTAMVRRPLKLGPSYHARRIYS